MADYKYKGLTVYINENEANLEKFILLGEAITSLRFSIDNNLLKGTLIDIDEKVHDVLTKNQNLVHSDEFQYLYENDSVCYPEEFELPNETPADYFRPVVEQVEIKGVKLHRLYIPTVAKNEDILNHFIHNALRPMLSQLFGSDLLHMKMKEATEFENFADGKQTILMNIENRKAFK